MVAVTEVVGKHCSRYTAKKRLALLRNFFRQPYSEAKVRPHQVGAAWKNIGMDIVALITLWVKVFEEEEKSRSFEFSLLSYLKRSWSKLSEVVYSSHLSP